MQYNLEKTFNENDKEILNRLGYPQPNELLDAHPDEIKEIYNKVTNDAKIAGYIQNQEMLRNQLALTEGLRANQRAITQGFNQLERLADMKELPEGENKDEIEPDLNPVRQKKNLAI